MTGPRPFLASVAVATAVVFGATGATATKPAAPHPPTPPVAAVPDGVWASWAVLTADGTITTGGAPGTNTTESMVKIGIAADLIARRERAGREPSSRDYADAEAMVRDSDNDAAERVYRNGGGEAVLRRIITTCRLAETTTVPGWWSETRITAADAVRLGWCVVSGRITSPTHTAWLRAQMQAVRGEGRFGLVTVRPALAVKNGWTLRDDGLWHVNCLAVTDRWASAVLLRYDGAYPLTYGADLCATIGANIAPRTTRGRHVFR